MSRAAGGGARAHGPRLVALDGAYNFRDLGGYPARDGRSTRWGRLYRSDALHELTEADLVVLRQLGLATVVDLRTRAELEEHGRGLLAGEPLRYRHLSVIDQSEGEAEGAPAPAGEDLAERYLWYLQIGRRALVDALETMSEDGAFPLVFHCTAGKDRTGVLTALVLDLLGVGPELIAEDYAMTGSRMTLIVARLRRDPIHAESLSRIPASRLAVEADTMRRFLEMLHEGYGSALGWALDAGLPEPAAARLADLLLDERD